MQNHGFNPMLSGAGDFTRSPHNMFNHVGGSPGFLSSPELESFGIGGELYDGLENFNDVMASYHDESTMEADSVGNQGAVYEQKGELLGASTSHVVKNECDLQKKCAPSINITPPDMLDDLKFSVSYVHSRNEHKRCHYWRSQNRLYVAPGKAFTLRIDHKAIETDSMYYIEIYPAYDDEALSHKPVLQKTDAGSPAMGVVKLVDGEGEEIEGKGGQRGVRITGVQQQVRLCLYKWNNFDSGREHLPVSLNFCFYDSERRLRGKDSMQVRVQEKPNRKCKDDKAKVEINNMLSAQQASVLNSDDEPIAKRARRRRVTAPPTVTLQLKLPKTRDVAEILESLQLRLKHAALHLNRGTNIHNTFYALYQQNIENIITIRNQENFADE